MDTKSLPDRSTARKIIEALKDGTTPLEAVTYIDEGRKMWYRGMNYYFDHAEDGGSKVRFICGTYGDGKTHLMAMAQHFAMQRDFVVSFVSAEHAPLNKFEEVYKSIVKNMRAVGTEQGIRSLLRKWKQDTGNDIEGSLLPLRNTTGLDINFRLALEAYLRTVDPIHEDIIEQWLLGEPVKLKEININRSWRPSEGREMMRSLSIFLRLIGYKGLMVLLDELDRIQYLSRKPRQNCYQVLRELMDNTDGQGGMQGALFYCAIPPDMFTSNQGFAEYDALWSRVRPLSHLINDPFQENRAVDYRGTIINLQETPLQQDDFYRIASHVIDIHKVALNWEAESLDDSWIRRLIDEIQKRHYNISTPRLVATSVARMADLIEQGQSIDIKVEIDRSYDIADKEKARRHRQKLEEEE